MKGRRGQQDIIVTVLLVLIAIAAVALIATFVIKNVKDNTNSADDAATCLKFNLEITEANNGTTTVKVKRTDGEIISNAKLKVIVNGAAQTDTPAIPGAGETKEVTISPALAKTNVVEATVILESGYTCPIKATKTVA